MMKKGTGRTKLGRMAALSVPGMLLAGGLGFAILQGLVAAQLSSANAFQVQGGQALGSGLELSLRAAETARSDTDATAAQKKSALVTLKDGQIRGGMCLAANNSAPVIGNIGLVLNIRDDVSLGDVDLSADAVRASGYTRLPSTWIGVAEKELDHQSTVGGGNAGAFGLESTGQVEINGLDADVYAIQLGGLELASGLDIIPTLSKAEC